MPEEPEGERDDVPSEAFRVLFRLFSRSVDGLELVVPADRGHDADQTGGVFSRRGEGGDILL